MAWHYVILNVGFSHIRYYMAVDHVNSNLHEIYSHVESNIHDRFRHVIPKIERRTKSIAKFDIRAMYIRFYICKFEYADFRYFPGS